MATKRKVSGKIENLVRAVKLSTGSNPGVLDRVGRAKKIRSNPTLRSSIKSKAKTLASGYKKDMAAYYSHKNTHGY